MRTVAPPVAAGSLALLLLAIGAFWPTYIARPPAQFDGFTHVHAAAGAAWLLLLIAQPLLILRRHGGTHRQLGRLAVGMAALFVVSSVLVAHHRFSRMEPDLFAREAYTLYLPLSSAALFSAACWLGLRHRRNVHLHARYLACSGLLAVDPVLGRFLAFHVVELPQYWHYQAITFSVEVLALGLLWVSLPAATADRRRFGRFAAVYAGALLVWFVVPWSETWAAFARLFRALPLT